MATSKPQSGPDTRLDGCVTAIEAQPVPCQVRPDLSHGKPDLSHVKLCPCRIKTGLGEVELDHRDIPLHRSTAKTDLTRSVHDLHRDISVVKPDGNTAKPYPSTVRPDGNTAKPYPSTVKPAPSEAKDNISKVKPDLFSKSSRVLSLNRHNFQQFVDDKHIAMILFYEPGIPGNSKLMTRFTAAACTTRRPGHAYAAVDCLTDRQFCLSRDVVRTPTIALYSFGNLVGSLPCPDHIKETQLVQFVEQASTLQLPGGHV